VNSNKEKAETGLFPKDSILELNTKKLGSSPSFLTITHMILSARRFRSYGILTINIAAEFCIWTEQQHNGSSISSLGLAKNFRSTEFHFRRQLSQLSDGMLNGSKRLAICELRQSETRPVPDLVFLADHTFLYKTGVWQNFSMTSPETLYIKNVINELSFLLVTHMT
jgi:hypothetical protein